MVASPSRDDGDRGRLPDPTRPLRQIPNRVKIDLQAVAVANDTDYGLEHGAQESFGDYKTNRDRREKEVTAVRQYT